MKIDILESLNQKRCENCGDRWGTAFAADGGICTSILCFQCILHYINNDGFEFKLENRQEKETTKLF